MTKDGGCRLPCATWSLHEACIPKWMATLLPEPTALQAVVWPVLRTVEVLQVDFAHGRYIFNTYVYYIIVYNIYIYIIII